MTRYRLASDLGAHAVDIRPTGAELLVTVDGSPFAVRILRVSGRSVALEVDGRPARVELEEETAQGLRFRLDGDEFAFSRLREEGPGGAGITRSATVQVESILPGKVSAVLVQQGSPVHGGDTLVLIDSMKMETAIRAEVDGTVLAVLVQKGDIVRKRQPLFKIRTGAPAPP